MGDVCLIDKTKHSGDPVPYVGLEDISNNTGVFLGGFEPTSMKSATFQFDERHLLYGRLRPYLNKALIPDFIGHCSSEIFPLRPKDQLDRRYLFYWMTSDTVCKLVDSTSTGARMPRANMNEVMRFEIPLPSLEEQRRIVAVLDEAFEGLDRARAQTEANLIDAKKLFDSFVAATVSGNSEHWPNVTLPEIAQNLDRARVPITKKDRKPGDVPYYGASGVVDYVADYLFDEDLLLVSEDGANLLARTYPIAFSISGKSWVNNHAHVLRFDDSFAQEFVCLYLNSISLEPYVSGMAQPKLNQTALNKISIPFPSESRRAEIVKSANSIFAESDRLTKAYQASFEDLGIIRQSLLQRAFAGELT